MEANPIAQSRTITKFTVVAAKVHNKTRANFITISYRIQLRSSATVCPEISLIECMDKRFTITSTKY